MSSVTGITPRSRVSIHFSLLLEDGTEIVSTFNDEPMRFTLGDGAMEPALESKLIGMKAGEEQSLILSGSDIYGVRDEENRQWLDRQDFPNEQELSEGLIIAFTTPTGDEMAGTVAAIEDERIMIDFNHPLSGRGFIFKTLILQVEDPE
ncbi:MAG: FKBP-type peptidyl-prolyl cis-trans isomerase [Candidatus Thiodiazotropha sp.]